jgi:hypothetical protein
VQVEEPCEQGDVPQQLAGRPQGQVSLRVLQLL